MKAANGKRVSGSANKVDEQSRTEPRLPGKDHPSNGLFRVGQQVHAKNILWNCIVFISPKYHRTCILDAKSRINLHPTCIESNRTKKIVRKIVPFDRLYPLSSVEITDDEALNERKNTIDDTHTSCRHYYLRDSNRGRFFFIPMERQCLTMIYGL